MDQEHYVKVKRFQGVYYRESSTKRYQGKADRCFYIRYKVNGKSHNDKVGWLSEGVTAQFASNKRDDLLNRSRHGEVIDRNVTLAEVWAQYWTTHMSERAEAKTAQGRWVNYIEPKFGHLHISQIKPLDVDKFKAKLNKGLTVKTTNNILALLRAIINAGIRWEMWSGNNPVAMISLNKVDNARERFFTKGEVKILLDCLWNRNQTVHDYTLLAVFTGMRAGELWALTWDKVNLDAGTITVDGKNGVTRTAYITPPVREMFERRQESRKSKRGHVFLGEKGGKIGEVGEEFSSCVDELEFNDGVVDDKMKAVFHTTRHTFGSWLAQQSTPIYTIKELMGHKRIEMTLRYAKLSPDQKQDAALQLAESFTALSERC